MRIASRIVAALAGTLMLAAPAFAKPPHSAFVEQAPVRSVTISPDGQRIAWVETIDGVDYVFHRPLSGGERKPVSRSDKDILSVNFLADNYLVMIGTTVTTWFGAPGKVRIGQGFIHNIAKNQTYPLDVAGDLYTVSQDGERAYFRGYSWGWPTLVEVLLSNGNPWRRELGGRWGETDWVVDQRGQMLFAQMRNTKESNQLHALDGTRRRLLLEEKAPPFHVDLAGRMPDSDDVVIADGRGADFATLRRLSVKDGSVSAPLFEADGREADTPVVDDAGFVRGAAISGTHPRYAFFDDALTKDMRSASVSFPGSSVWLQDWSADWRKLVLFVVGGPESGRYVLFDRDARKFVSLMQARPALAAGEWGEVISVEYKASDGLTIPAILTWPAGSTPETRKSLPLVVLPHGGPEMYDRVSYDPTAQFLANEGYAVLQPNFRGSAGYGASFRDAGKRQFGRKMQDDVTDGVEALAAMGWIDKQRVCIMGYSYGGYAALAGAALTPDLYRCAISVSGVTDLPSFLTYMYNLTGAYSYNFAYWRELLGDPEADAEELRRWSPTTLAPQVKAHVLLIHGENDESTPVRQSRLMERALKDAGKNVRFLELQNEGHNLSQALSRSLVFTETANFLAQHLKR